MSTCKDTYNSVWVLVKLLSEESVDFLFDWLVTGLWFWVIELKMIQVKLKMFHVRCECRFLAWLEQVLMWMSEYYRCLCGRRWHWCDVDVRSEGRSLFWGILAESWTLLLGSKWYDLRSRWLLTGFFIYIFTYLCRDLLKILIMYSKSVNLRMNIC